MKKIKKKVPCQCDGWAMHVSVENLPLAIIENDEIDLNRVYYCKKCETYIFLNKPRSKMKK